MRFESFCNLCWTETMCLQVSQSYKCRSEGLLTQTTTSSWSESRREMKRLTEKSCYNFSNWIIYCFIFQAEFQKNWQAPVSPLWGFAAFFLRLNLLNYMLIVDWCSCCDFRTKQKNLSRCQLTLALGKLWGAFFIRIRQRCCFVPH